MNTNKFLVGFTLISASIFTLFFAHSQRPNLCIKSKFITKINYLNQQDIYNCYSQSNKPKTPWSRNTEKIVKLINEKLQTIEDISFLKDSKTKLVLNISNASLKVTARSALAVTESKNYFSYHISEENLLNSNELEIRILKKSISEINPAIERRPLLNDLLAEFAFTAHTGKTPIKIQQNIFSPVVFWKDNQSSCNTSCITNWKITNNLNFCINKSYQFFETEYQFIYERLYKVSIDSWNKSFLNLDLKERYKVFLSLDSKIKNFNSEYENKTNFSFNENIKILNKFWLFDSKNQKTIGEKKFLSSIASLYSEKNFYNTISSTFFDVIYFKENLDWANLAKDKEYSKIKKSNLNIAFSDFKNMVISPLDKQISNNSFYSFKAKLVLVEFCQKITLGKILDFAKYTDRLILTYNCKSNSYRKLDQLLDKGANGFALQNPDIPFIQFHLPSLMMKKELLDLNKEVFDYVIARDIKNPVYQLFGWRELNWDELSKSYHPKAYVDAISVFRTTYIQ